jgi:hypothetical protein
MKFDLSHSYSCSVAGGAVPGGLAGLTGRETNSPLQFGHLPAIAFVQAGQNVHS